MEPISGPFPFHPGRVDGGNQIPVPDLVFAGLWIFSHGIHLLGSLAGRPRLAGVGASPAACLYPATGHWYVHRGDPHHPLHVHLVLAGSRVEYLADQLVHQQNLRPPLFPLDIGNLVAASPSLFT